MRKTDIMAYILKSIMDNAKIEKEDYAIIAGYGLREFREVTDIDVSVSKAALKKLKKLNYLKVGKAKLSDNERLFIELPYIGHDAEIEIFEAENKGFPSDKFSLRNLQKNKYLTEDSFGNPYINLKCVIELYSDVKIINNKIYVGDNYEISLDRLNKNISHLNILLSKQKKYNKLIKEKINFLEEIKKKLIEIK